MMQKIRLEVTGFYYARDLEIGDNVTKVEEVMDIATRLEGFPKLGFVPEPVRNNGKQFIKTIFVNHDDTSAKSGQKLSPTVDVDRTYPAGLYVGEDDAVSVKPGANPILIPRDDTLKQVKAWQYYVYEDACVDLNRKNGARVILPFNEPFPSAQNPRAFKTGDVIVWRQVTIAVKPTYGILSNDVKGVVAGLGQQPVTIGSSD